MNALVTESTTSVEAAISVPLPDLWRAGIYLAWRFPEEVIEAWNRLAAEYGDAGIFLSHAWFNNVWTCFGYHRQPLTIVLYRHTAIVAIVPLWYDPEQGLQRSLGSLTNDHTCLYDILVSSEVHTQALGRLAQVISWLKLRSPLQIDYVPATGAGETLVSSMISAKFPVYAYQGAWAPEVRLAGRTWAEYEGSLHAKFRTNLKRRRRLAEKEGRLSFSIHCEEAGLEEELAEAFNVEASGWKGVEGTAIKNDPEAELFYGRVAAAAAQDHSLYLFSLRHDGRMIAFSLSIACGKTLFQLKTGYDQAGSARFSPGTLLHWEILQHLYDARTFEIFNLLGACAEWKTEWLGEHRQFRWMKIYPDTWRGRLDYAAGHGWKERLKQCETLARLARLLGRHTGNLNWGGA
jgi:CelD/BcsL family acetyltransferase involved in cellulose biosynthesis